MYLSAAASVVVLVFLWVSRCAYPPSSDDHSSPQFQSLSTVSDHGSGHGTSIDDDGNDEVGITLSPLYSGSSSSAGYSRVSGAPGSKVSKDLRNDFEVISLA